MTVEHAIGYGIVGVGVLAGWKLLDLAAAVVRSLRGWDDAGFNEESEACWGDADIIREESAIAASVDDKVKIELMPGFNEGLELGVGGIIDIEKRGVVQKLKDMLASCLLAGVFVLLKFLSKFGDLRVSIRDGRFELRILDGDGAAMCDKAEPLPGCDCSGACAHPEVEHGSEDGAAKMVAQPAEDENASAGDGVFCDASPVDLRDKFRPVHGGSVAG